jgi:hypothetical protein
LFLAALIIPSVLLRENFSFSKVLTDVTRIVTCFTLAHSITLIAAALKLVMLPSWLVETAIALSVAIAGCNIIFPVINHCRGRIAFVFGLVHGFGFASVLSELSLSSTNLYASLGGFNLGVEAGQLLIVMVILPILYAARNLWSYQKLVIPGTGAAIVSMGCFWVVERGFSGFL